MIEPPQATTPSPEADGCGLGHAERGTPEISRALPTLDGTKSVPLGVCDESLRDRHGRPAGEELGTAPADRATVNVGTVRLPTSPALAGWSVRRSVRFWRRAGRSFRSSPSRGKPGTWRREAAGLQRRLEARRSSVNTGASWPSVEEAEVRLLGIQRKLHKWAGDDQARRFSDLHNLVCDSATLRVAWQRVRRNRGSRSAGVDGQTAYWASSGSSTGCASSFAWGPIGRWPSVSG